MIEKAPKSIPRSTDQGFGNDYSCQVAAPELGTENLQNEHGEALVQVGLLTSRPVKKASNSNSIFASNKPSKVYELTDKGRQMAQESTYGFGKKEYLFQFCKVSFKEVSSYTEPSDGMGVKSSNVKFKFALVDFADWAKNEAVQKAYWQVKSKLDLEGKVLNATQFVVLTSEGWATELPK
jgi:hypothetical protein